MPAREGTLRALNDAAVAITSAGLSTDAVLQRIVDVARDAAKAKYAALGVADEHGVVQQFYTSGITAEERAKMEPIPQGHGLLGELIHKRKVIRIPNIEDDPRSVGFPPNHPVMHSLLGVPIINRDEVLGNLYITDKIGAPAFNEEDERFMLALSRHAAIAIENSRLSEAVQRLAVIEERDRIAKDLHDGVLQSIYGVGLGLEDCLDLVDEDPEEAKEQIERAIESLNGVIRDIRNYIFGLRPASFQGKTLQQGLADLIKEFQINSLIHADLTIAPTVPVDISAAEVAEVLHMVRETLTNVAKHAKATRVRTSVEGDAAALQITIVDNGRGFDVSRRIGQDHHGLRNIRERAGELGGYVHLESTIGEGTRVFIDLPLLAVTSNESEETTV